MGKGRFETVPFKKLATSKAWKLTSEYVRRKANGRCYTCERVFEFSELNGGHFREKIGNAGGYFDLRNIKPQCYRCNRVRHGEKEIYATKLVKEYGATVLEDLRRICLFPKQWTRYELDEIAELRKKDIANL